MPYPQDLLGKYVNYTVDPGGTMNAGYLNAFVNGVLPGQTTVANVPVYAPPGPAIGGPPVAPPARGGMLAQHRVPLPTAVNVVNTNTPWTFTFLKYIGGAVTTAPLATPILTGPMSGCFLCTYNQGGLGLAHVGTANATDSKETRDVKAAWLAFVARHDVSGVMGANPFDYITDGDFQAASIGGQLPSLCGYFDGTSAYAILFAPLPRNQNPPGLSLMKVTVVKRMTLQPWASLAALPAFAQERADRGFDPTVIRLGR